MATENTSAISPLRQRPGRGGSISREELLMAFEPKGGYQTHDGPNPADQHRTKPEGNAKPIGR